MKNIIEAANLPENDKVYLRKGKFGYRVVYPTVNEDGSKNWINILIGGWGNFITLIFIMFVILCFLYGVKEMTTSCRDMAENPCAYFNLDCQTRYMNKSLFQEGDFYEYEG